MNHLARITCFLACIIFPFLSSAQQENYRKDNKPVIPGEVQTASGKWRFWLFPENIIKATFTPKGSIRNEQVSDAVISKPVGQRSFMKRSGDAITISWGNEMAVDVNDTAISFLKRNTRIASLRNSFYSDQARGFRFQLQSGEMIYGTGERSIPLNRRGYKLNLNNAPAYGYSLNAEALNFSVPFILSSKQYAIFFDNPSKGYLDIGKTNPDLLEYSVTSGELSFYIIPGQDYASILQSYHNLVGTAPLPPRWAMGNLVSRFGYRDERQVKQIVNMMKRDSVPFDAVIFDLFWFGDSIKNTLGNLNWMNKKAWPDPAKMISDFKDKHIKTILITEPFILKTSANYDEAQKLLATDSTGNTYTLQEFYFGKGGIIDIFRKDAQNWFYKKYKAQMDIGVTGWWGDLGEPENHPADVYHDLSDFGFKRKFASGEVHNIYGHYWSKMLSENFRKDYPGERLFHLNRSGYAGSPRYNSYPWSGDISRSWDGLKSQIPLIQGMSLSGIPYIHSDAGGFAGGEGDAELYVRWLQFAAFTPIYRPHGTALGNLEPTVKDIPSEASLWPEPARTRAKNAAIVRYQWMPYNYNLTYQQTKYGKPLVSPMFFLNNSDSNLYKAADQYLWGDEVMVAPITDKNQKYRTIYIPEGLWYNMNSFASYMGPRWVVDSTFTMEAIPVFAKEAGFIPFLPGMQNTDEYNQKILNVIYLPSTKSGKFELYEDDGADANALKNRQFEITTFSCEGLKPSTSFTISSNGGKYKGRIENRKMILSIPTVPKSPKEIRINNRPIPLQDLWNESNKILNIPFIFQHTKTEIVIQFS